MSQEQDNKAVKLGMLIGLVLTLTLYLGAYSLVPVYAQELPLIDRVRLAIECLIFPGLFLLVTIIKVGAQRYGNPSGNPTIVLANSEAMEIDLRVLSNTHEQLVIFVINTLGLAIFLPFHYLSLLPIYSGLFIVGRILYWLGYRYNIFWRAPGFAMAVMPAMFGLLFSCVHILQNIST